MRIWKRISFSFNRGWGWVVTIVEAPKAFHHGFSSPLVSSVERRFYLNRGEHVNTIL